MSGSVVRNVKDAVKRGIQKYQIGHEKRIKLNQFKDKRRTDIFETVQLSDAQKKQIDDLYLENYGEKIPYTWHRHFTAFTGHFDANYFPEHLFIPEFEFYMNLNKKYGVAFEDKNVIPMIAAAAGVKMPKTILSCTSGLFKDESGNWCDKAQAVKILQNDQEFFAKPSVDTYGGEGCRLLKMHNGVDEKTQEDASTILNQLGDNFVVQERVQCHPTISAIYPGSVNTFRVITYRWQDEILYMPIIMRIGSGGGYVDNASAGGMFIAVDPDGTLHKTAFTEFKKEFTVHPDTQLTFEGYQIPGLDKVIAAAIRMHTFVAQLGCVNWDFTLNDAGEPVLIEANAIGGSIDMLEMTHGTGPFGDRTPEVLRWLKQMNHMGVNEQRQYLFGKMKE